MNKYLLRPKLGSVKEGFFLDDENGSLVCEGQVTKFSLFGAAPFEIINHKTGKKEEHKIGKTITAEEGGNDLISFMSRSSWFKYDGQNIWHYLHDLGIRIDSKPSSNKIGMTYEITLKGKNIAVISSSSPKGKSLITTNLYYDVMCEEEDLDLVFLVALSIAKTDQVLYN